MFNFCKNALAAGAFSLAAIAPASASVIFFDSFEAPDVATWLVFQTNVGDTGAWNRTSGAGIEIQDESLGITAAFDGEQYVELDSDSRRGGLAGPDNSGMAANIDFVEGRTYEISFAYRPRTNTPGDNIIDLFAVNYDGTDITSPFLLATVVETITTLPDWIVVSVLYTATSGINGIGFLAGGIDNARGGFIDAVQVAQVPLPAALPLFGFGIAGLAAMRRRKRTS